jgi:hypothetical protein
MRRLAAVLPLQSSGAEDEQEGATAGTMQIYKSRELASNDVADCIDRFYNRTRRRSHLGGVSPEQFEAAHNARRQGLH